MAGAGDGPAVEAIVEEILASPKYRRLDPAFVRRVVVEAVARHRSRKEAVKHARRKLHQAAGAFAVGSPADAVRRCAEAVRAGADLRAACREAMAAHVSTAERAAHLEELASLVAGWVGRPASVADLACGLGPLAIPWLDLAPGATYWCCDVDAEVAAALADWGTLLDGVALEATTCDLTAGAPPVRAELGLLLKTVPTLEQQRAGAARDLLAGLACAHVVASLPRRSIGGGRRYADDPDATLAAAVAGTAFAVAEVVEVGDEVVAHLVAEGAGAADRPAPSSGPAAPPASADAGAAAVTVVGTPPRNVEDAAPSVVAALAAADVVCAEDTRRTRRLLAALGVPAPRLVSVRAANEVEHVARVAAWAAAGRSVAVVTDAGMPAVSDPGERLVAGLLDAGVPVRVVPGPDAATAALAASGLPSDRWAFEGFLPRSGPKRAERLAEVAGSRRTVVLFEAPHRLAATLADLAAALDPDREVAVVNDATKAYERVWRGPVAAAAEGWGDDVRGEFVVVVAPLANGGA